ncbi:hypothetical protein GM921_03970 [Pedobacter sp. LMG 31464]|uniref:Uncharacterized protein n=1 Tax=Pedobacter planticolens TaxID=2679964 RepID=A0A923IW03_9SPHI|nr:hypothetical protein [Pedobacter planticolens]MBB2144627.1 hypothetical protein [Pedobacter planticolens]
MYYPDVENSRITPQKAVEILKAHGTEMTEEEAVIALEFIKKFLKMAIKQQVILAEKYMEEAQKRL